MKSTLMLSLVLIVMALLLAGCWTKEITAPEGGKGGSTAVLDIVNIKDVIVTTVPIHAGNSGEIAGTVSIWNDLVNIYVTYETTGGWMLSQTHVHLDDDLVGDWIHLGQPIPGQFDYQADHNPMVTTYSYTIPLSNYTFVCEQVIYVITHCVVNKGAQSETGFGGDIEGDANRWWWYTMYTIQCPEPPDPPEDEYMEETAMVRTYDSPTDFTYRWVMGNGKNHPWFSYVKTYPVLAPQTYYFYAGQSAKAGEVQIWKEGDFLKIQLDMMNTWEVTGTHLNVSLQGFVGPPAFGLFPYCADHSPFATTYTYSVPWDMAWDGMELNVALHGDARKPLPPARH